MSRVLLVLAVLLLSSGCREAQAQSGWVGGGGGGAAVAAGYDPLGAQQFTVIRYRDDNNGIDTNGASITPTGTYANATISGE